MPCPFAPPVSRRVFEYRYYPPTTHFFPPQQERPLLYLLLRITHHSGLVLPPAVDLHAMLCLPILCAISILHVYILRVFCGNPCSGLVTQQLPQSRSP